MSNFTVEIFKAHHILQNVLSLKTCPEKHRAQLQKIVDELDQIVEGEVKLDDIHKFFSGVDIRAGSFDSLFGDEDNEVERELKEFSLHSVNVPSSSESSNPSQIPSPALRRVDSTEYFL